MCKYKLHKEVIQTLTISEALTRYSLRELEFIPFNFKITPYLLSRVMQVGCNNAKVRFCDCLPKELFELIKDEKFIDDDQKVKNELLSKLSPLRDPRNKNDTNLDSYEIYKSIDYIENEIELIFNFTQLLHGIIFAKDNTEQINLSIQFIRQWMQVCTHDDDKSKTMSILFESSVVELFATLDILTNESGRELINCLKLNVHLKPESVISFVRYFSRIQKLHKISSQLQIIAQDCIDKVKSSSDQAELLAELSRAYMLTDLAEAKRIFELGELQFNKIGTRDDKLVWLMIKFAATIKNSGVSNELAFKYAKFCEVNVHDRRDWDWGYTAVTLAGISGINSFAQIARWYDRDKIDMYETLPYALSSLLKSKLISSPIAISLLKLIDSDLISHYNWERFVSAIESEQDFERLLASLINHYEIMLPGKYKDELPTKFVTQLETLTQDTKKIKDQSVKDRVENLIEKLKIPIKHPDFAKCNLSGGDRN